MRRLPPELAVRLTVALTLALVATCAVLWRPAQPWRRYALQKFRGQQTVLDVLAAKGPQARERWRALLEPSGIAYPPRALTLIALKEERRLEIWADVDPAPVLIREVPILAVSGGPGPKLRRGDQQAPEGVYRVQGLNPNSAYHLSIQIDYPNGFDRRMAREDGRTDLGGLIFIHGKAVSIGCVAIGDEAIEDLFVMVADTHPRHVTILMAPWDLRVREAPEAADLEWAETLYTTLREMMLRYPRRP